MPRNLSNDERARIVECVACEHNVLDLRGRVFEGDDASGVLGLAIIAGTLKRLRDVGDHDGTDSSVALLDGRPAADRERLLPRHILVSHKDGDPVVDVCEPSLLGGGREGHLRLTKAELRVEAEVVLLDVAVFNFHALQTYLPVSGISEYAWPICTRSMARV